MKKSNVIGLTVGIVVTIVAVSLISWFAIRPVPTLIQGEVEATDIKISSKLAAVSSKWTYRKASASRKASAVRTEHARSGSQAPTGRSRAHGGQRSKHESP